MNRFLFIMLTTGLSLATSTAQSQTPEMMVLYSQSVFGLKENSILSDRPLKEKLETRYIGDTSKPGKKNKSTTAQDYNSTRSNKSNYVVIINIGNNTVAISTAQDFNTTRSNRQNSNYQMGITGNSGNNSGNSNDSVPKKNYAQDFNTTRSNRQNSNYQMGIIGNSGNNSGNSNDSVPKKNYAQDFNTTRSNRQNSNYQMGIIGNSGNNSGNNNDSVPQKNYAQDFNTTRSNRQNSNYQMGIIENSGNNSGNNNDSVPQNNYAQDFNTTRSNRQNSNYNQKIVINVGENSPSNKGQSNLRIGQGDGTEVIDEWSTKVIVVNLNDSGVTQSFRKLRTPPTESYNPWEMDDPVEGTVMNPLFESPGNSGDNPMFESASANAIIINIDNSSPNSKDSLPGRQEYGDYNSTRSNKANCVVIINVHNNGQNNNDSIPSRQEAQDYNSSRSNKTYPRLKNPLYHNKGNSGSNPMYEGTNKNGISEKHYLIANNVILVIREMDPNKNANQEKGSPLYGGENTERENPLFEGGHAFTGNNGGDSSQNPGKQPSRQEAQDYNSTRSNKCNCFSIEGGFANGNSNHTGNGWNIEMENQIPISKRLKMAFSAGYAALQFKYKGSQHLSEEYVQNMKESIRNNKWSLMTLSAGPVLQLGKGKLTTDLYGKAGITFIQVPDQFVGIPDNEGTVTKETGAAKFAGSTTALSFQAGVQFNYAISRRIDIFLNPNFFSSAGKIITYKEKDASKALNDGKTFDYKAFLSLPYETKQEQLSMLGVNAGLKFRFCR